MGRLSASASATARSVATSISGAGPPSSCTTISGSTSRALYKRSNIASLGVTLPSRTLFSMFSTDQPNSAMSVGPDHATAALERVEGAPQVEQRIAVGHIGVPIRQRFVDERDHLARILDEYLDDVVVAFDLDRGIARRRGRCRGRRREPPHSALALEDARGAALASACACN